MKTMRLIKECERKGAPHDRELKVRKQWECHLMPDGSFEMQIIADEMESCAGLGQATHFVNSHRAMNGAIHVGRSCVCGAFQHLQPDVSCVAKQPQGSLNVNSTWCKVNFDWSTQICSCCGFSDADELNEPRDEDGDLPNCLNPKLLTPPTPEQICFWDKSHKQVKVGAIKNGKQLQVRIKQDQQC